MSKHRNRLQIIADVLSIARQGAKKTPIMYQANLSYRLLDRYIREVLNAGLVNFGDGNRYVLTAKGREFLHQHTEYSELYKSLEKRLSHINRKKIVLENMCLCASRVNNNVSHLNKNEEFEKIMR